MRAHPRSRGEHHQGAHITTEPGGSSPLTRGARIRDETTSPDEGLIPAHAGSTAAHRRFPVMCAAHPRSRGEHFEAVGDTVGRVGSSPLTRGALLIGLSIRSRMGLIPAHAGSTGGGCEGARGSGAHPRSRGEHRLSASVAGMSEGSSPLTRGAPDRSQIMNPTAGLIPAHAGSTKHGWTRNPPAPAHPRSRGEHDCQFAGSAASRGSSPLTRGARPPRAHETLVRRLIPAHAGSTIRARAVCRRGPAHPRSRGEHIRH